MRDWRDWGRNEERDKKEGGGGGGAAVKRERGEMGRSGETDIQSDTKTETDR